MKRAYLCTQRSGSNLIEKIWCGQKMLKSKKRKKIDEVSKQNKKLWIIITCRKMECAQERMRNKR